MHLIYELIDPQAKAPTKAFPEDAGWDVYSLHSVTIEPHSYVCVRTGLKMRLEPDAVEAGRFTHLGLSWYLRAAPKSGLASRGLDVLAGVIDRNYRGEVRIIIANHSPSARFIEADDKVCQIIPELIVDVREAVPGLVGDSDRGSNGFGSSGK